MESPELNILRPFWLPAKSWASCPWWRCRSSWARARNRCTKRRPRASKKHQRSGIRTDWNEKWSEPTFFRSVNALCEFTLFAQHTSSAQCFSFKLHLALQAFEKCGIKQTKTKMLHSWRECLSAYYFIRHLLQDNYHSQASSCRGIPDCRHPKYVQNFDSVVAWAVPLRPVGTWTNSARAKPLVKVRIWPRLLASLMGQKFEPRTAAHCVISGTATGILGSQTLHIQACCRSRHHHGPNVIVWQTFSILKQGTDSASACSSFPRFASTKNPPVVIASTECSWTWKKSKKKNLFVALGLVALYSSTIMTESSIFVAMR